MYRKFSFSVMYFIAEFGGFAIIIWGWKSKSKTMEIKKQNKTNPKETHRDACKNSSTDSFPASSHFRFKDLLSRTWFLYIAQHPCGCFLTRSSISSIENHLIPSLWRQNKSLAAYTTFLFKLTHVLFHVRLRQTKQVYAHPARLSLKTQKNYFRSSLNATTESLNWIAD